MHRVLTSERVSTTGCLSQYISRRTQVSYFIINCIFSAKSNTQTIDKQESAAESLLSLLQGLVLLKRERLWLSYLKVSMEGVRIGLIA